MEEGLKKSAHVAPTRVVSRVVAFGERVHEMKLRSEITRSYARTPRTTCEYARNTLQVESARNVPRSKVLQLLLSIATVACTEDAQKKSRAAAAAATLARVEYMLMRLKLV